MPNYHRMYLILASAQADAVESLKEVTEKLMRAQQEAEDILVEGQEPDIRVLPIPTGDSDK